MLIRHQTLRTAIGWSCELRTTAERLLWSRLSVFAGSFELSAAERVCGGGELPSDAVLETLVGLVDKSVVQRVGDRQERYRLLDAIREYAADLLTASGTTDRVAEEHLATTTSWAGACGTN